MPSKKRTDTGTASGGRCALCWRQEGDDIFRFQAKRNQHFLTFPHSKVLESHLLEQYGEEREKDGGIRAIVKWYAEKKKEEQENRSQFDSDAREPENVQEPVWGDDREN